MRGDNHLAGAPRHWVHGTLAWRPTMRWNGEAAVRWSPAKIPVDNLNTLFNDPYATLDLRVERRFGESLTVFAERSNVFDETWASSTLMGDSAGHSITALRSAPRARDCSWWRNSSAKGAASAMLKIGSAVAGPHASGMSSGKGASGIGSA